MLIKLLIQIVLWQGVMAILLFAPAGTINWTGAWIFLVETSVVSVVLGLWLARHDPMLLKERLRSTYPAGTINPGQDCDWGIGTALFRLVRVYGTRCHSIQMVSGSRVASGSRCVGRPRCVLY